MIKQLTDNQLVKLLKIKDNEKILDVGGSGRQHQKLKIHTLVDISRPEDKPYKPTKLLAEAFVKVDLVKEKLPFKDNEFDVVICTHTLEDLSDPFLAIEEISRVGKRGYVSTPSRGQDSVFDSYKITEWGTGAVRQPGLAHHKWFFENRKNKMYVVPKNYPLLYSREFQHVGWSGEQEFRFTWKGSIKYQEYFPKTHHELIEEYRDFFQKNSKYLEKGLVAVFIDKPIQMIKENVKKIIKRGLAYQDEIRFEN